MMMIATISLVQQKKGAQRKEEEKVGGRRKRGQTGIPTPGADAPTGPTRSGVSDNQHHIFIRRWSTLREIFSESD